jgi:hypothetical protein
MIQKVCHNFPSLIKNVKRNLNKINCMVINDSMSAIVALVVHLVSDAVIPLYNVYCSC